MKIYYLAEEMFKYKSNSQSAILHIKMVLLVRCEIFIEQSQTYFWFEINFAVNTFLYLINRFKM